MIRLVGTFGATPWMCPVSARTANAHIRSRRPARARRATEASGQSAIWPDRPFFAVWRPRTGAGR